jgi:hypothetical protein
VVAARQGLGLQPFQTHDLHFDISVHRKNPNKLSVNRCALPTMMAMNATAASPIATPFAWHAPLRQPLFWCLLSLTLVWDW